MQTYLVRLLPTHLTMQHTELRSVIGANTYILVPLKVTVKCMCAKPEAISVWLPLKSLEMGQQVGPGFSWC